MKILMIGPDIELVPGGMSSVVKNYLESELSSKVNITYLPSNIEAKLIPKICFTLSSYIEYLKQVKKNDLVHIHMAERGSFYRKSIFVLLSKIFKRKIIVHFHGAEFDKFYYKQSNVMGKKYINFILDQVDLNIALGKEWEEKIRKYSMTDVIVLNNAVYTNKENLFNNENKCITLLGRLEERKGIFDLLDIADEIIEYDNSIEIVLAGDGNLNKVREVIKTKKYKNNIKVLGWIDKVEREKLLTNSLIFTLPSYNEGMPMAILEAMSFGLPLVVSNVGGIPSVVEEGENGYLINPGDKEALKTSIMKLLKEKDNRVNISKNNYNKINEYFNLEKNVEMLYEIYRSLV